ncbi:PDZ domain [Trinorchestia longiramus]|nr:PDZ domain [Trinorchestia longiramus]
MARRSNAARQREARANLTLERRLAILRNNAEQYRVARESLTHERREEILRHDIEQHRVARENLTQERRDEILQQNAFAHRLGSNSTPGSTHSPPDPRRGVSCPPSHAGPHVTHFSTHDLLSHDLLTENLLTQNLLTHNLIAQNILTKDGETERIVEQSLLTNELQTRERLDYLGNANEVQTRDRLDYLGRDTLSSGGYQQGAASRRKLTEGSTGNRGTSECSDSSGDRSSSLFVEVDSDRHSVFSDGDRQSLPDRRILEDHILNGVDSIKEEHQFLNGGLGGLTHHRRSLIGSQSLDEGAGDDPNTRPRYTIPKQLSEIIPDSAYLSQSFPGQIAKTEAQKPPGEQNQDPNPGQSTATQKRHTSSTSSARSSTQRRVHVSTATTINGTPTAGRRTIECQTDIIIADVKAASGILASSHPRSTTQSGTQTLPVTETQAYRTSASSDSDYYQDAVCDDYVRSPAYPSRTRPPPPPPGVGGVTNGVLNAASSPTPPSNSTASSTSTVGSGCSVSTLPSTARNIPVPKQVPLSSASSTSIPLTSTSIHPTSGSSVIHITSANQLSTSTSLSSTPVSYSALLASSDPLPPSSGPLPPSSGSLPPSSGTLLPTSGSLPPVSLPPVSLPRTVISLSSSAPAPQSSQGRMTVAQDGGGAVSPLEGEGGSSVPLAAAKHWGPERVVQVYRDSNNSLGISIVGGQVELNWTGSFVNGIFIKNVLPSSPAGKSGLLKVGLHLHLAAVLPHLKTWTPQGMISSSCSGPPPPKNMDSSRYDGIFILQHSSPT